MGAEYNADGADLDVRKNGRYFLTLTYVFKSAVPLANHSLILLADGERIVLDRLQVARYASAASENVLVPGGGIVVYLYQEVPRDLVVTLSNKHTVDARLNNYEFSIKPRYMNTLREFLNTTP